MHWCIIFLLSQASWLSLHLAPPESRKIFGNETQIVDLYTGQTVWRKKRLQTRNVMRVAMTEEHWGAQELP